MPQLSTADHRVSPPRVTVPRDYNAAYDLIQRNLQAGRAGKVAFIDDAGSYTYGELAERVNRFGNVLAGLGIEPESRVMLCLLDTIDFPTAFLGSIQAGVVPIAANTLLTASDYDFMLGDSRACALVVSEALWPQFEGIVGKHKHLKHVIVSGKDAKGQLAFSEPDGQGLGAVRAGADDLRRHVLLAVFLRLHRLAEGHGAPALAPDPDRRAVRPAGPRHPRGRPGVFRGQAVLRLRPRQRHDLPDVGRRDGDPDGRAADAAGGVQAPDANTSRRSSTACRRCMPRCSPAPSCRSGRTLRLRMCTSAGEALPADIGKRWTEHFGVEILDGIGSTEMLHIFLSNRPGEVRYGTTGKAVPGYGIRLIGEDGQPVADGEIGELQISGPSAAVDVLEQAREVAPHLHGRVDAQRRQVHPRRGRLLPLLRPLRRHAQGLRHLRLALRGRGRADDARGGAGGRRGRRMPTPTS